MHPPKTTLSIVTVSLNEATFIERLKMSIDALDRPQGTLVETILIDAGSQDDTVARAKNTGFDRVVETPGSTIPQCRNLGARTATGTWLAYVDADCELAKDWLKQAFPFLQAKTSMVIGWPAYSPTPGTWVQRAWQLHWTHKIAQTEKWKGRPVVRFQAFRLLTTRNLLLHREAFDQLNGFDEELLTGEDTDFVFRAHYSHLDVIGVPALRVIHHGEPHTLAAFFRQQLWHANWKSYVKIAHAKTAGSGANAPLFTLLYSGFLLLALMGILGTAMFHRLSWLLPTIPLLILLLAPATMIAIRTQKPTAIPALFILYATYGFARSLDLLGCFRDKKSWKSKTLT